MSRPTEREAGELEIKEFPEGWEDMDVLLEVSKRLDELAAALRPESPPSSLGILEEPLTDLLGRLANIVRIERLRHRAANTREPGGLKDFLREFANWRRPSARDWENGACRAEFDRLQKRAADLLRTGGGTDGALVEPDRKEGWRSRLARRLRAAAGPQGIEYMEMEDGAVLTHWDLEQAALTLEHCEEHHPASASVEEPAP